MCITSEWSAPPSEARLVPIDLRGGPSELEDFFDTLPGPLESDSRLAFACECVTDPSTERRCCIMTPTVARCCGVCANPFSVCTPFPDETFVCPRKQQPKNDFTEFQTLLCESSTFEGRKKNFIPKRAIVSWTARIKLLES